MKRFFGVIAAVLVVLLATGCAGTAKSSTAKKAVTVEPGYWKSAAKPELATVIEMKNNMNIGDDEFIVFYVRDDRDYDPWALWLWAPKGGDGSKAWDYTQTWEVENGIAYMRFKYDGSTTGGTQFVDDEGNVGLIVRKDDGWTKEDRKSVV